MRLFTAWLAATRPKTLVASVIPVLLGHVIASSHCAVRLSTTVLCLISALLIQIGTNLYNDTVDFSRGVDSDSRSGPRRLLSLGLATQSQVRIAAHIAFFLALVVGSELVRIGGLPILALGAVSIICGYGYSAPPLALAYRGLGEPFVIFFFGVAAVTGVTWLHCGALIPFSAIVGAQVGLLATTLLIVNNIRDINEDAAHSKRTLAARFGRTFATYEILFVFICATLLCFFWPRKFIPFSFVFLVPAFLVCKDVISGCTGSALNKTLGKAALTHLIFGVTAIICFS